MPFVKLPDGGVAHICIRGGRRPKPCAFCGRSSSLLCDGKVPAIIGRDGTVSTKKRTCSKPLCLKCAERRSSNFDLCPPCAKTTPHQLELP